MNEPSKRVREAMKSLSIPHHSEQQFTAETRRRWTVVPLRADNPILFKIVNYKGEQIIPFTWEDKYCPQTICDAHNKPEA